MKTQKRRKRERKTDYKRRLNLLKSDSPRLVLRISNKYILTQYVKSEEAQDKVIFNITSKELLKKGWPEESKGSLKSISASYLTGLLAGKMIKEKNLDTPIIDIGMRKIVQNSRIFSFIKGLIDTGIKIKSKEEKFPNNKTIKGDYLKNKIDIEKIKSSILNNKNG